LSGLFGQLWVENAFGKMVHFSLLLATVLLLAVVGSNASQFSVFLSNFDTTHFTVTLPSLITLQASSQTDLIVKVFGSVPVASDADALKNALTIQANFLLLSEAQAQAKFEALETALLALPLSVNSITINSVLSLGTTTILPHYLTAFAQLDTSTSVTFLGDSSSNRYNYRALILGLNALIVAQLNNNAVYAKFALNTLAGLDPTDLQIFRGLNSTTTSSPVTSSPVTSSPTPLITTAPTRTPTQVTSTPTAGNAVSANWVAAGVVGPVQNQGSCGSCWAFVAAAVIESRLAVSTGASLKSLSRQQLVSCAISNGCSGGNYETAWQYTSQNGGLVSVNTYGYDSGDDGPSSTPSCVSSDTTETITTTGTIFTQLPTEAAMLTAVENGGPIAISISTPSCFQYYSSGILTESDCDCYGGSSSIDHAVVVVGYGTDSSSGIQYWQVQNSWGANWGLQGYVLLQRGVSPEGMCGLLTDAKYPNTVLPATECESPTAPSYCSPSAQVLYTNTNATSANTGQCVQNAGGIYTGSSCNSAETYDDFFDHNNNGLPVYAWILIGVGAIIFAVTIFYLFALVFLVDYHPRERILEAQVVVVEKKPQEQV